MPPGQRMMGTVATLQRILLAAAGALAGLVVGWLVAVNVIITFGIDRGYEATIPEVFRENPVAGAVAALILVAGPVLGAWSALRLARSVSPPRRPQPPVGTGR